MLLSHRTQGKSSNEGRLSLKIKMVLQRNVQFKNDPKVVYANQMPVTIYKLAAGNGFKVLHIFSDWTLPLG